MQLQTSSLLFGTFAVTALVAGSAHAMPQTLYESGHADVAVSLNSRGDDLVINWKFDNAVVGGQVTNGLRPIESVAAFTSAKYRRPASDSSNQFAFLGVAPGQSTFYFPIDNTTSVREGVPFLGWSNDVGLNQLRSNLVNLELKAVNGRGAASPRFSLWDISGLTPRVYMTASDGISSSDRLQLFGHSHYFLNLGASTQADTLVVTMEASAEKLDGTRLSKEFDLFVLSCTPGVDCPAAPNPQQAPVLGPGR